MATRKNSDTWIPDWLSNLFRRFLQLCGWLFLIAVVAALLGLPWPVYNWLDGGGEAAGTPDVIVMMGGGGIPSESGLTRTWQTAREAARFPKARVIVAMPYEAGESAATRSAVQRELILRGVSESRLSQEGEGRHTREQAIFIRKMFDDREDKTRLLIVTSPEHVRRSVLSFQKAGFTHVRGRGALSQAIAADLTYRETVEFLQKPSTSIVGQSMMLRYKFWDNLIIEAKIARELTALVYYKFKGWI